MEHLIEMVYFTKGFHTELTRGEKEGVSQLITNVDSNLRGKQAD